MNMAAIESFLHEKIPITRSMQIRVVGYDGDLLTLEAPIAANHNHLGTAFGGSLSAIATLAGYTLLWLELNKPGCHVVIAKSSIAYHHPVRTLIRALCRRPNETTLEAFKQRLATKGKASIPLKVSIEEEDRVAVEFDGIFVALADH